MRTKRKPDLDDVRKQFEAWRRRRPQPPFPPELWQAACGLLDRHTAHTICETLRLNESRFKQMRDALGPDAAGARGATRAPCSPRAHRASRATTPLRPAANKPELPVFVDLGVVGQLPEPRTPAERAAGICSLVIERPDGARLALDWPAPDSTAIALLCTGFLESGASTRRGLREDRR